MASEMIHKIIFLKSHNDIYLPAMLVSQNGQNKQWIIPKLINPDEIVYEKYEIERIINLYNNYKRNVCYLYRGKWVNGKKISKLLNWAFKKSLLVEELRSADFPSYIIVYGRGENKIKETGKISGSDDLLRFVDKYRTICINNKDNSKKIIPLLKFPKYYIYMPNRRERKKNIERNQLESELIGSYVLYIKEGSSINGYIKSVDNKRINFTPDIFEAKSFTSKEIASNWAARNGLWNIFGIKCTPVLIENRSD